MIERVGHVRTIRQRLRAFPVVAILGPRQIGKTTLARQVTEAHAGPTHHLDLEHPADLIGAAAPAGCRPAAARRQSCTRCFRGSRPAGRRMR